MTFEKLKEVIVEAINCDEGVVTLEASLTDDLGADSLDAYELNMAIEEACGVLIPDSALAEMKTVGDILNFLQKQE